MISYRPCEHPCPWWCVSTGPNHIGRRCAQTGDRTRSDVQKYPQKSLEHEKMNNAFFRIWAMDPCIYHNNNIYIYSSNKRFLLTAPHDLCLHYLRGFRSHSPRAIFSVHWPFIHHHLSELVFTLDFWFGRDHSALLELATQVSPFFLPWSQPRKTSWVGHCLFGTS